MASNSLVPTPIVDKNGKRTVVHKRAGTSGNTAKKIPSPVVASTPPKATFPVIKDNAHLIVDAAFYSELRYKPMSEKFEAKTLETLHPDTLARCAHLLREKEASMEGLRRTMRHCTTLRNFKPLNNLTLLLEDSEDRSSEAIGRKSAILIGLHVHNRPTVDLYDESDPRVPGVRALVDVISKMEVQTTYKMLKAFQVKKDLQALTFQNLEVEKLIMDYPDRAQDIIDLYDQRELVFDRELYEMILNDSPRSLQDGVL